MWQHTLIFLTIFHRFLRLNNAYTFSSFAFLWLWSQLSFSRNITTETHGKNRLKHKHSCLRWNIECTLPFQVLINHDILFCLLPFFHSLTCLTFILAQYSKATLSNHVYRFIRKFYNDLRLGVDFTNISYLFFCIYCSRSRLKWSL
jgi:hypothetical protein